MSPRRRVLWPALAAICLLVMLAERAGAQTSGGDGFGDPNRCQNSAGGQSGLGGGGSAGGGAGGGGGSSWGEPVATGPTTTIKPVDRDLTEGEEGDCSSLLDTQAVGPDPGQFPSSHYDIGYDNGGKCICWARRFTGNMTNWSFSINRWIVRQGLGIIGWVLDFKLIDSMLPLAQQAAANYQAEIVDPIGLVPLFLGFAALWGGMLVATGKVGRGVGEFGASCLIFAICATTLSNPGAMMAKALKFTAGVSWEMAAAGSGDESASPTANDQVGSEMLGSIHHSFVEQPHEILDWSRLIPSGDPCRGVYEAAVASGPWGTSSKPRVAMKNAGCTREDAFNRDPSDDRFIGAMVVASGSGLVVILITLIAATMLGVQLGLLGGIALFPLAAPFGLLPGRGRALFWRLLAFIGVCFAGVVTMAMLLSITLLAVSGTFAATGGLPIFVRMFAVDVVVVVAFKKRKKLFEAGGRAVTGFTSAMTGTSSSYSHHAWLNPGVPRAAKVATLGAAGYVGGKTVHGAWTGRSSGSSPSPDWGDATARWKPQGPGGRRRPDWGSGGGGPRSEWGSGGGGGGGGPRRDYDYDGDAEDAEWWEAEMPELEPASA